MLINPYNRKIPKKHKYGAVKTMVDGIKFDSKLEADIYVLLKKLEKAGLVYNIRLQVPFLLLDSFKRVDGKTIRKMTYKADFVFRKDNGEELVVDAKGMVLNDFKIKKKIFEYKYNKVLHIVKTKKDLIKLVGGDVYGKY